ncbi:Vanillyl-alcohol oxidase C-terminal subdomain 1 [Penicillium crustosum]|uniref:Vanillyl-alcohol oxidase C-terminal subdomain 1 n=1 Tax=Penicillium crustosum TaxID=36656 RepID=UPI0023A5DE97|nr:Vanillyl-alcohol oxidase C-terminal subdomain 1 [Penicillium crustosum]KAJ5395212.1 Vanillyl-alcohol oxidase C-terminal subdomain 1 [Penicillium crustosum]
MNADEKKRRSSACAVGPTTVEEIQKILAIANEYKLPLWAVSRGKNLGYGDPHKRVKGSIIVDLQKMNKILDVNKKFSYYTVEPGVTFFQLFQEIQAQKKHIWCSSPSLGWGIVVRIALDRGWGYTHNGDHSNQICGIEVVLPGGTLVRTGMGAHDNSVSGPLFRGGYGPTYDSMFSQSNFGIVTKMTIWASPAPEGFMQVHLSVPEERDLAPMVDILRELLLREKIQNHPVIGNVIRQINKHGLRKDFWNEDTSILYHRIKEIQKDLRLGFWDATFALYGPKEMMEYNLKQIQEAFKPIKGHVLKETAHYPEPSQKYVNALDVPYDLQTGNPGLRPIRSIEYRGLDGGHISFSPVLPSDGKAALDFHYKAQKICEKHGYDFVAGLHMNLRHMTYINMIHFDCNSQKDKDSANALFVDMVRAARETGYGEYRAHIEHMDLVAEQYDYGGGALMRLNERIRIR